MMMIVIVVIILISVCLLGIAYVILSAPATWKFEGCWKDTTVDPRVIPEYIGNKTLTECKAVATSRGFNVVGMQWGKEGQGFPPQCWIGLNSNFKIQGASTTCGTNAAGEGVGDGYVNSVYKFG